MMMDEADDLLNEEVMIEGADDDGTGIGLTRRLRRVTENINSITDVLGIEL